MPGSLVRLGRFRALPVAAAAVMLLLSAPVGMAQASGAYKVYFGSGQLPPLPQARVSLDMEVDDADEEVFRTTALSPSLITEATPQSTLPTWRIADWRAQLDEDVRRIETLAKRLADRYDAMERGNFPVALRHMRGSYESVAELERLAQESRRAFGNAYPDVRDDEKAPHPPQDVRRTRLFRDRAESIHSSAERFLARAVDVRESTVVRLGDDED